MTNPDNIVRVRARNGGRASVYEANGWGQGYSSGLIKGNGVLQNTVADMNVLVGGSQSQPDVILAENPAGYKIALDLVGQQAITITAPAQNSRISSIVAYTDDLSLPTTEDTVTGSPASCGLIVVNGAAASTPTPPDDTDIRTAITADGATGSQAAYCVIANITVENSTTMITDTLIDINTAELSAHNVDFTTSGGNSTQLTITGSVNSNSTSYKDCSGTYTIPETGLYFLYSFVSTASATSTKFGLAGRVLLDSTVVSIDPVYADSYANRSSNNFAYLYIATAFWANKDSIVTIQTRMDNWTGKSNHHTTIQRIF